MAREIDWLTDRQTVTDQLRQIEDSDWLTGSLTERQTDRWYWLTDYIDG